MLLLFLRVQLRMKLLELERRREDVTLQAFALLRHWFRCFLEQVQRLSLVFCYNNFHNFFRQLSL